MQKNLAVAILLSFAVLIGWDMLVLRPRAKAQKGFTQPPAPSVVPSLAPEGTPVPDQPSPETIPTEKPGSTRLFEYETGRHRITFNLRGGSVWQWVVQEEKGQWVPLVPDFGQGERPFDAFPARVFIVQKAEGNRVVLESAGENPRIQKQWVLSPDGYLHEFSMDVWNTGKTQAEFGYALGWGPGIHSGDVDPKEQKRSQRALAFAPPRLMKPKASRVEGSFHWWGVDGRYFLAALVDDSGQNVHIDVTKQDGFFAVKKAATIALSPGQNHQEKFRLYVGPKGYAQLASLGLDLERSVDFGMFGGLGKLVLQALYTFHRTTKNYGWSIVILTVLLQLLLLPLTMKSFRHSLRMKAIQPQMKKIQELYKKDPKRLNAEMLHLYQRHGMKFMGMEGCFPMLLQLPVFWALYTTLRNAYELRYAPWVLWIKDLSAHDPFYLLPVLMGAGMLAQQKMTMSSADPTQARMMYMMPIIFTFFFLKLPSGLVLYWLTNSIVSVIVQLWMLKKQPSVEIVK